MDWVRARLARLPRLVLIAALGFPAIAAQTANPPRPALPKFDPYRFGILGFRGWPLEGGIRVAKIVAGTPAEGRLVLDDVVLEVNGRSVKKKALAVVASEIDRAEGRGGSLTLSVQRDRKRLEVEFPVDRIGRFGQTYPRDTKTDHILADVARYLAPQQRNNGKWPCYPRWTRNGLVPVTSVCGLAYLGMGDLRYLPTLKRARYYVTSRLTRGELRPGADNKATWRFAFGGIFLAEQYLATGDMVALAKLPLVVDALEQLQEPSGGWPHSLKYTTRWRPHYREFIAPSYHALIALALIRKCGLEVPQPVIDKGVQYVLRCEKGGHIKYRVNRGTGTADPGRAAGCAVAFMLLGVEGECVDRMLEYVEKRMDQAIYGHISALQHFFWTAVALRLASHLPEDRGRHFGTVHRKYMQRFRWYVDLARDGRGFFVPQPKGKHFDRDNMMGHFWTTGSIATVLALGRGHTVLSGATPRIPRDLPRQTLGTKTLPGDDPWTISESFLRRHERNGVAHVSTYADRRDADVGVAHRTVSGARTREIVFTVHGGTARLVLVAEETPPPAKISDVAAFEKELLAGEYGAVVASVRGPRTHDMDLPIRWPLAPREGGIYRIYLVDSLAVPWGFVSVSTLTLVPR